MGQITTSFHEGFEALFEEIRAKRPDLNNNSQVAQEAVREYWKNIKANQNSTHSKGLKCGLPDYISSEYSANITENLATG